MNAPQPLTILFQDEHLVAIDKPAGHLVHPAEEPQQDDLVAMKILRDQIGQRVHTIHRLDRPTCGVLLFGLDPDSAKSLHRSFEQHKVTKIYHAIIEGEPKQESWSCDTPLQKYPDHPFKAAKTEFKKLRSGSIKNYTFSLIQCRPLTGRFHQIRRHLLESDNPITGDYRYNSIERCDLISGELGTQKKMLLLAHSLTFPHPTTGSPVQVNCPAPEYFPTL